MLWILLLDTHTYFLMLLLNVLPLTELQLRETFEKLDVTMLHLVCMFSPWY